MDRDDNLRERAQNLGVFQFFLQLIGTHPACGLIHVYKIYGRPAVEPAVG